MRLTDTTPQEVVLALRSTGASDEDVLYAAKTEFAEPFRYQKILGVALGVLGLLMSLTGIGAMVGVPTAGVGIWMWRKGRRNLVVVDSAFAEYRPGPLVPEPTACADYTAPAATAYPPARRGQMQSDRKPSDRSETGRTA